jgi:putative endonuclease
MAAFYVLFSEKLNRFYIGSCNNLQERIDQHVNKMFPKSFAAKSDDWILYCSLDNLSYAQARSIEKYVKSQKSKIYLLDLKSILKI